MSAPNGQMFTLRMKDAQQVTSTWNIIYSQWQPDSEEQGSSSQDSQWQVKVGREGRWRGREGGHLSRWFPRQLAQDFHDERGVEFKL